MPRKKKLEKGTCKLCKTYTELNFEHIPPSAVFNKNSRYYTIPLKDYSENAMDYINKVIKPKSRVYQGGMGEYCLCSDCNSFLGAKYVREYKKFAELAYSIINTYPQAKCY